MNAPKIKVCGITSMQQVQELALSGADYAGFIFYEKSPRFIGTKIPSQELKAFEGIQKVGVFVNETLDTVLQSIAGYGLNAVQLHGDETPEYCKAVSGAARVIKAFRIKGDEDLHALLATYEHSVDYFLFDTKAHEYGGTGKKFDWSVLENTTINKPYFLSGGIGLDDANQLREFTSANNVFSVDVNSKFEVEPGVKNMAQVKSFIRSIR